MGPARRRARARAAIALLLLPLAACGSRSADGAEPAAGPEVGPGERGSEDAAAWPLVLAEDFEDASALEAFAFSDPEAWRWSEADEAPSLELFAASDYAPPHRSPLNVALVAGLVLGDFDLELEARQTGREYGHRDLCLFFSFEAPDRYHYVHLATTPDANAHNVFVVDGAPRRNLLEPQESGVDWSDGWHSLRLERRVESGTVRVFFDDAAEPTLETNDANLGAGLVGIGSFDDVGRFARLRIRAPSSAQGSYAPFER